VTILAAVRQLLAEPNPDDPLDQDATEAYVRNRPLFDATARRMVAEHAGGGAGAAAKRGEHGVEDQQQQQG
jgi:ubiquitin-conjugating enzyme E2 D/E